MIQNIINKDFQIKYYKTSCYTFSVLILGLILFGATGCTPKTHKAKVVQPKKHYVWYNHYKHSKKKRTKLVTFKSHTYKSKK